MSSPEREERFDASEYVGGRLVWAEGDDPRRATAAQIAAALTRGRTDGAYFLVVNEGAISGPHAARIEVRTTSRPSPEVPRGNRRERRAAKARAR